MPKMREAAGSLHLTSPSLSFSLSLCVRVSRARVPPLHASPPCTPTPPHPLHTRTHPFGTALFLGEHDFRNFCKMDISGGVTNYKRKMLSIDVSTSTGTAAAGCAPADPRFQVGVFTIVGHAFLWHQIRYMTAVLFMVGRGEEDPSIITKLLDTETNPKKPQYEMVRPLALTRIYYHRILAQPGVRSGSLPLLRVVSSIL